jgi:hypothetical protein
LGYKHDLANGNKICYCCDSVLWGGKERVDQNSEEESARFAESQSQPAPVTDQEQGRGLMPSAEATLIRSPDATQTLPDTQPAAATTSQKFELATRPTAIHPVEHELTRAVAHVLSVENQQLRAENQVFIQKEEERKEKRRQSKKKWRKTHPEKYNAYMKKYMEKRRAEGDQ